LRRGRGHEFCRPLSARPGRIEFLDPLLCTFLDAERPIVVGVELVVAAEGLASRVFALASSA
jgi:hypothetical protein